MGRICGPTGYICRGAVREACQVVIEEPRRERSCRSYHTLPHTHVYHVQHFFKSINDTDMVRALVFNLYFFFALSRTLSAQDTYFTTPPTPGSQLDFSKDPVYAVNSQVQLGWVTNVQSYSVWLWQQAGGDFSSATCGSQIYCKRCGRCSFPPDASQC